MKPPAWATKFSGVQAYTPIWSAGRRQAPLDRRPGCDQVLVQDLDALAQSLVVRRGVFAIVPGHDLTVAPVFAQVGVTLKNGQESTLQA